MGLNLLSLNALRAENEVSIQITVPDDQLSLPGGSVFAQSGVQIQGIESADAAPQPLFPAHFPCDK
jgi:hypothetical protein